jgi:hypothetical protein
MTSRSVRSTGQPAYFRIARIRQSRPALPLVVRWGSDRRRRFRRHPHVGIAHLAESVAAECGVLEPDFRNRYEEKSTYSSV